MTHEQFRSHLAGATPVLPGWMTRGRESGLDCETAVQLRAYLSPLFDEAAGWPQLCARLATKGFRLAFCGARLVLVEHHSGRPICTTRALGHPLQALSARLGRLSVRASPAPATRH